MEARPGGLKDLDLCPSCSCPAAVHYNDPTTRVFKCPAPGTDPQRMIEMVRRAPGINTATSKAVAIATRDNPNQSEASRLTEWWKDIQRQAGKELPELEPFIIRLARMQNAMTPREIVIAARGRLALAIREKEEAVRENGIRKMQDRLTRQVLEAERLVGAKGPGIDANGAAWRDPQRDDEPAPMQAAPPPKPSGKRRYNLDE